MTSALAAAQAHLLDASIDVAENCRAVGLTDSVVRLEFVGQPVGHVVAYGVGWTAVHVIGANADGGCNCHLRIKMKTKD